MRIFLNIPETNKLVLKTDEEETKLVLMSETGRAAGKYYEIGEGLKVEGNTLSVDTAEAVEDGNTKPVESNAVYNHVAAQVGNIEILLETI